ncbi:hypothetical protein H0H93_009590 [Arthromyces matolae]|nr:hypothetical protein H0H93_009590 [Arthromyces matolae]
MIIIRPRNLISASLICLGLFLVSATPIPSPNAMPGAVVVLPPTMGTPYMSHSTSLTSPHTLGLLVLLLDISEDIRNQLKSAEQLIGTLRQIPGAIRAETDRDALRIRFYGVFARFKLFLTTCTWDATHRAQAIAEIEISEKAATAAGMTQARIPGEEIVTLDQVTRYMDKGVTEFDNQNSRPNAVKELVTMMKAIRYISIADLRGIIEKSNAKYDKVKEEVEKWPVGYLKTSGEHELIEWEAINSLVDPRLKV